MFLAFELIFVYGVEPWLYGRSTGLSPIAIIAAVIFWTWLWGPVGLLLATPLTVCVAVMGRYIPEFGFLNVLLGVEPVLPPEGRLYQRLIALDDEEAIDVAEEYANEHGLLALHDAVVIPALGLAEQDRHRGVIDEARERFVFDTVRKIIEDVEDRKAMKEEAQRKAEEGEAKSAVPVAPARLPRGPRRRCASSERTTKPITSPAWPSLASCRPPISARASSAIRSSPATSSSRSPNAAPKLSASRPFRLRPRSRPATSSSASRAAFPRSRFSS